MCKDSKEEKKGDTKIGVLHECPVTHNYCYNTHIHSKSTLKTHQKNEGQVKQPSVVGEAAGRAEQGICVLMDPVKDTIIPSNTVLSSEPRCQLVSISHLTGTIHLKYLHATSVPKRMNVSLGQDPWTPECILQHCPAHKTLQCQVRLVGWNQGRGCECEANTKTLGR